MRRLFSSFARGWPGVGLLIMRLVCGSALVLRGAASLHGGPSTPMATAMLAIVAGFFLLAGMWTPIAGALGALAGIWFAASGAGDPLTGILLAAMGAGLALVGPGAWSIDARLFGWKRIDIHNRRR